MLENLFQLFQTVLHIFQVWFVNDCTGTGEINNRKKDKMADKLKIASLVTTAGQAIVEHGVVGLATVADEAFEVITGIPDPTVMVALLATDLTIDVIYNIWNW